MNQVHTAPQINQPLVNQTSSQPSTEPPVVPPSNAIVQRPSMPAVGLPVQSTISINQGQISNVQGTMPSPGSTAGGWHSHSIGTIVKPVQKQEDDDDFADFQEAPKEVKGMF